jgi:hypothetical protein
MAALAQVLPVDLHGASVGASTLASNYRGIGGLWSALLSNSGSAGQAPAAATADHTAKDWGVTLPFSGGNGGAGMTSGSSTSRAGGLITGVDMLIPTIPGGTSSGGARW